MKKKVLALTLSVVTLLACFMPINALAEEPDKTKIKLNELYVTVPYQESKIDIDRQETNEEVRIIIKDKKSGEVLRTFGELKENTSDDSLLQSNYTYTVYEEVEEGPTTSRLSTQMYMYSDGSFRQINSIQNTWWAEMTSGPWELDNEVESTVSTSGGFPTTEVQTQGYATITCTITSGTSGEFSVSALEAIGFAVTESTETTTYLRKDISCDYTYSCY